MADTTEIILNNGRFIRRITSVHNQDLGTQETLLASLAEPKPAMIHRVTEFNGKWISFLYSKTSLAIATELDSIPFKTWFSPRMHDGEPCLEPVYSPGPGNVEIGGRWSPPTGLGSLHFVAVYRNNAIDMGCAVQNCFLFLFLNSKAYYFPYPNLYSDGRICMGTSFQTEAQKNASNGYLASFMHAYRVFQESQMNAHLVTDGTREFFRRVPDKGWKKVMASEYRPFLQEISNAALVGFGK